MSTATTKVCPICNGDGGRVIPEGGHYICQELAKRNLPVTPMYCCPDCQGCGTTRKAMPAGIFLPMNPSGRELELWFPPCPRCNRKGYVTER